MKKIMMYITTLALCFMVMGDLTFASETEVPVMDESNAKTEEVLRGPITAESEVRRSGTVSIGGLPSFTFTCWFNITYNSGTGELYTVDLSSYSGMSGLSISASIIEKKRVNSTTMDVTVRVDVSTGEIFRGRDFVTFRI